MSGVASAGRVRILFPSLRGYQRAWLPKDLLAGVTVWAVLVPECLAYATIAGVPPVVGLYAAVPSLVLYAAFGSSKHLIVSPMSATAALSVGIVGSLAGGDPDQFLQLTAALAVVTGVLAILAGLARLGFLASFISTPVFKGFIVGLALTIIAGQLPKLFGITKGEGDFFMQVGHVLRNLGDTNLATLAVGLVSLGVLLVLRRWLPLVPGSLVVVLLGIAATSVFHLQDHGVSVVGTIESGLPTLGPPGLGSPQTWLALIVPAAGVLLVGYAEGLAAAKTYAALHGYRIDPNRELVGLGAANLGSGLSSGMVVNGSLSKTAVNGAAGAKSQLSSVTIAALVVITLLFLTGLFEKLPESTLAAVVIAAVVQLVDIPSLVRLYKIWTKDLGGDYGWAARADFLAALAALLGVLIFDTLPGLLIGVAASMLLLVARAAHPNVAHLAQEAHGPWLDVSRHPELSPDTTIVVLRVESGLFFANADYIQDTIRAAVEPGTRAVVLDAQTAPFIDVTATDMLTAAARDLQRRHVALAIAHPIGQIRDILQRAAAVYGTTIDTYPTVDDAVDHLKGT